MNDDRSDLNALTAALEATGQRVKGKSATCPWHDDENPSASLLQGQNGHWRIYCHTCDRAGDVFDIRSILTGRDEFRNISSNSTKCLESTVTRQGIDSSVPPTPTTGPLADKRAVKAYADRLGTVESWHPYGPATNPVLVVARIMPHEGGKKTFRQFTAHPDGTFSPQNLLPEGSIPLYKQDTVGPVTLVVEGEKACDAVCAMGVPCVTSAMGAGKAHLSDWSALIGKRVILWPDNDATDSKTGRNIGKIHMEEVAIILNGLGVEHQTIDPTQLGLPVKGDAFDFIMQHGSDADTKIRELIDTYSVDPFYAHLEKQMRGEYGSVPLPWPALTEATKALLPGAVTLLVGNAGATKSFMILEAMSFWISKGVKVACCELEENKEFWQQRVLAQVAKFAKANDPDWIKENNQAIMEMYHTHGEDIRFFGRCVHCPPLTGYTLKQLGDWIEVKAKEGTRVIVADPITACKPGGKEPWNEAQDFILRVKGAAATYKCSVVLATHGRKGQEKSKGPPDMDSMAGGAAYARFASCVLWVDPLKADKRVTVLGDNGELVSANINRRVRILKSRNGKGTGMIMGMFFDGTDYATIERGVIMREPKDDEDPVTASHTTPPPPRKHHSRTPSDSEDLFAKDTP